MAYINFKEATQRYPILADWAKQSSDVSSGLLHYAEKQLDSMLASHFTVPFSGPPQIIKDLAIDFSYLKALMPRDIEKGKQFAEYLQARIDAIKAGSESIVTDSGTIISKSATGGAEIWSTTQDYHSVHSFLDAEDSYTHISSGQLQADQDARD